MIEATDMEIWRIIKATRFGKIFCSTHQVNFPYTLFGLFAQELRLASQGCSLAIIPFRRLALAFDF